MGEVPIKQAQPRSGDVKMECEDPITSDNAKSQCEVIESKV